MKTPGVAVLLVAGVGSRLSPLTDDRPKALLDVGGESILARATRLLVEAGVRRLVVATGYRSDAVRAALDGAGCPVPVRFCDNPDYARTQNAVSLSLCAEAVAGEAFFKLDGDVLFHRDVLARLSEAAAPLAVAIDSGAQLGVEEMKVIVRGGVITSFGKELDPRGCAGESIGIECVREHAVQPLFAGLREARARGDVDLYYEAVYGELIGRGVEARPVDVSDLSWTEVDTPEDLTRARELVRSGRLDQPADR